MRTIAALSLAVIACAACTSVWFAVVLKPTTPAAFAFLVAWLVSPHAVMGATLLVLERKRPAPPRWHVVAIVVSIGGVLFLSDVIFWHSDAQGAIAVFMTPLYQAVALAVLLPLTALAFKLTTRRQP